MDLFLIEQGSFSYDNENIGDKEVPLSYIHYLNNWEHDPLPEINIDLCINGRAYWIDPSNLHGMGFFTIDGVNVPYNCEVELMDYVIPK